MSRTGTLRKTVHSENLERDENGEFDQVNLNDASVQLKKQISLLFENYIKEPDNTHQPPRSSQPAGIPMSDENFKTQTGSVQASNAMPVNHSGNNHQSRPKLDKDDLKRLRKLLELVQLLDDDTKCTAQPPAYVEPVFANMNINQPQRNVPEVVNSIHAPNQQSRFIAPRFNQAILNQQINQPVGAGNVQQQYHRHPVNNNPVNHQPQPAVFQPNFNDYPRFEPQNYDRDYRLMQRWNLTFNGGASQNVLDFVYRLETLAINDNYPQENLTRVLHLFLKDKANDWYWVYRQNHVVATWCEMREAFISYFGSFDAEEETREQIIRRFQGSKETFSDFCLEIQKLNGRLREKMNDVQIINRLCHNMLPALRNVTLPYQNIVQTVEELRVICNRFEKMWDQTGYDPRRFSDHHTSQKKAWIHSCQDDLNSQVPLQQTQITTPQSNISSMAVQNVPNESLNDPLVAGMRPTENPSPDSLNNLVCWNCSKKGHRYQDCDQSALHVFCYGCGQQNILKPNCLNCQKRKMGNWWTNASQPRESRSDTNVASPSPSK